MAYYSGSVAAKNLFTTILNHITAVQPGETQAWWVKESSVETDGVYTSTGSSGNERIVLVFREHTVGQRFTVGMAKDYTPGAINTAGAFDSLQTWDVYYYSAIQNEDVIVSYDVNVTKDRVIIHVQGDKLISAWQNTVIFLGMPLRYDPNDHLCIVKAQSEGGGVNNKITVLQDSINTMYQNYDWFSVQSPANPSWGNTYFLETLHFGYGNEGLRGELDGIYGTHPGELVDGDEIDVLGTRYKVIISRGVGQNNFPRTALLLKMA